MTSAASSSVRGEGRAFSAGAPSGAMMDSLGVFMVRQLPPWFENISERQVKAPKVYVRDTGLLHALLGIANRHDLEHHPKVGSMSCILRQDATRWRRMSMSCRSRNWST
jgi:hypothetical protein